MGDLDYEKEDWYHGELTREEAEQALESCGCDCFLIRESKGTHVLSLCTRTQKDNFFHLKIEYGPCWCKLHGSERAFIEIQELVSYYQQNHDTVVLGTACVKKGILVLLA